MSAPAPETPLADVEIAPQPPRPGELTFAAPRRAKPPRHLADLTPAERKQALTELGHQGFRAAQISQHYFGHLADDPAQWYDVPAAKRGELAGILTPKLLTPIREQTADAGTTRKTLWRLFDGATVESVLMRYRDRTTMCVSSQAGCGMNCPFCATGQARLNRHMSTGENLEQVGGGGPAEGPGGRARGAWPRPQR